MRNRFCRNLLLHLVCLLSVSAGLPAAAAVLVTCGPTNYGLGDQFDRGFYVPSYPGSSLQQVTLRMSGGNTGAGTITLTARAGNYGGTIIGTSVLPVVGPISSATPLVFAFPGNPAVTSGTTVTFTITTTIANTSTPPFLFYSIPTTPPDDPTCPVIQTNGTTPPLDSFRRNGVEITISGDPTAIVVAPVPTPTLSTGAVLLMFMLIAAIGWQAIRRSR